MQRSTQAVFLVDINAFSKSLVNNDESSFEKSLAALRLATLKLLTYFLHSQIRGYERVKWGYKFYNSIFTRCLPQKCALQEMRIDSFEDFENDVIVRLTKERERLRKLHDLKSYENFPSNDGGFEEVPSTSAITNNATSHSASLKNALKELLCDFQWDRPDITSPIRKTKHRTKFKNDVADSDRQNVLFIISECPRTADELLTFLGVSPGSAKLNANTVFSSLITSTMQSVYCGSLKLRVFWVDTSHLSSQWSPEQDCNGYDLMDEALTRLNGTVIPISSLVQLSSSHVFSVTSVISWYIGISNKQPKIKAQLVQNDARNVICEFDIAQLDKRSLLPTKTTCNHSRQRTIVAEGLVPNWSLPTKIQSSSLLVLPAKANRFEFFGLLHHLLSQRMCLVVNCGGDTGVLVPLTLSVATLEIISCYPNGLALLTSECSQCKELVDEQLISSNEKSKLQRFIQSSIGHIVESQTAQNNARSSNSAEGVISVRPRFSGRFMDKWFCSTATQTSSPDSIIQSWPRQEKEAVLMYKVRRACCPKLSSFNSVIVSKTEDHSTKAKQGTKMNVSARATRLVSYSQAKQLRRQQKQLAAELQQPKNSSTSQDSVSKPKENKLQWLDLCNEFELSDENEVRTRLRDVYQDSLDNSLPVLACAENIVNIVLYYMKSTSNTEACCKDLLVSELYKTPKVVNESYENVDNAKDHRIREYKLQALLRLETMGAIPNECDQEKLVDEIAAHLRNISFVADPVNLGEFVRDVVYHNYISSLPDVVKDIFDELNQPLPHGDGSESTNNNDDMPFSFSELDGYLSEANTADTSSVSSQADPNKRKSLQRYHSFSEVGQKRQIVVPGNPKFKGATQKRRKSRVRYSPRSSTSQAVDPTNDVSDVQKVCRNLFERGLHSPLKGLSSEINQVEPKKKHVLKTKEAPNTPTHKQVANAHLQKQARLRRNTKSLPSMAHEVVEESPMKAVGMERQVTKDNKNKHLPFYPPSAAQQSRSVHRLKLHFRSKSENIPSGAPITFASPEKARKTRSQYKSPKITSSQSFAESTEQSSQRVTRSQHVGSEVGCTIGADQLQFQTINYGNGTDLCNATKHVLSSQQNAAMPFTLHNLNSSRLSPKQLSELSHKASPKSSPSTRVTRSRISLQFDMPSILPTKRRGKLSKNKSVTNDVSNQEMTDSFSDASYSQASSGEQKVPSEVDHSLSPELFCNLSPQVNRMTRNQCKKEVPLLEGRKVGSGVARRSRKNLLFALNADEVNSCMTPNIHSSRSTSIEQVVPLSVPENFKVTRSRSRCSSLHSFHTQSVLPLTFNNTNDCQNNVGIPLPTCISDSVYSKMNDSVNTVCSTNSATDFSGISLGSNVKSICSLILPKLEDEGYECNMETSPTISKATSCTDSKTHSSTNALSVVCSAKLTGSNFKAFESKPCNEPSPAAHDYICSPSRENADCSNDSSVIKSSPVLQGTVSPEPLTLRNLRALNDLSSVSIADGCRQSSRGSSNSYSSSFQSDEISFHFTDDSELPVNNSSSTEQADDAKYCYDNTNITSVVHCSVNTDNLLSSKNMQPNSEKLECKKSQASTPISISNSNSLHSLLSSKFPLVKLERFNFKMFERTNKVTVSSLCQWRKIKPRYGTPQKFRVTRSRAVLNATDADLASHTFQSNKAHNHIRTLVSVSSPRSASATPSKSDTPRTLSRKRRFSTGELYDASNNLMFDIEQAPVQRLTRNLSKEIGITVDEFKRICTKTPEKTEKLSQDLRNLELGPRPVKRQCLEFLSSDSDEEVFFSEKTFQKDGAFNTIPQQFESRTRKNIVLS